MSLLGDRLREARESIGYSQTEVYRRTKINNKTLSRYEKGGSEPDTQSLNLLSKLYDVSVDWLVGRTNDKKKVISLPSMILIDSLDLTDEQIMEKIDFVVDGVPLSNVEIKRFIEYVRVERSLNRKRD